MRLTMQRLLLPLLLLLILAPLSAQSNVPNRTEARELFGQMADLMEAAAIVTPELARAGAPLTESVRQSIQTLDSGQSREHSAVIHSLLTNARIFIQLADALPKAPGYSDDARGQLEQLRRKLDRGELYFRHLLDRRERQILSSDRDNLARYADANQTVGPPNAGENRVVFLGDSITDAWRLNEYFPGKPYINRGISGQITGQMLGRMQSDVIALKPRAIVLLAGTNDLARGVSLETIRNNFTLILDLAAAHNITAVVASILPVSDHHAATDPRYKRTTLRPPQDILELNNWLLQTTSTRGIPYLDYFVELVDDSGQLRKDLAPDGLHPNAEGYKLMAPLAEKAIAKALAGRKAPQRKRKRFGVF